MIGKMIARPLRLGGIALGSGVIELGSGVIELGSGSIELGAGRYRTWSLGAKGRRHLTI